MDVIVEHLNHTFNHHTPGIQALNDLTFQIASGEFVAVIGANGCGKSTLLRLFANLLEPTEGHICLNGQTPAQMTAEHRIIWMAQNPALLPWFTARENILMARRFTPPAKQNSSTVDELLEMVDLSDFASAYPNTLSGGMQQRLALARALAINADLWLMDEPFASLDELTRERLTLELVEIWERRRPTVLWVTHHIPEAVRLSDRVLVMTPRPGRIHAEIPVALPRPREDTSLEFQALVKKLKELLFLSGGRR